MMTKLSTDNLRTWLEHEALEHGTLNQRERYNAGVLPESELVQLARDQLFARFYECKRWNNLSEHDARMLIRHKPCPGTAPGVLFGVVDAVMSLTHDQWESLRKLKAIAELMDDHTWCKASPECKLVVTPRLHIATCKQCGATLERTTALVSSTWAGRLLTREYAL